MNKIPPGTEVIFEVFPFGKFKGIVICLHPHNPQVYWVYVISPRPYNLSFWRPASNIFTKQLADSYYWVVKDEIKYFTGTRY